MPRRGLAADVPDGFVAHVTCVWVSQLPPYPLFTNATAASRPTNFLAGSDATR